MKTPLKLLSALLIITLLSAFKHTGSNDFLGTYGVSSSDPSQIKLTLNPDHSFYYQDFSSPGNKIIVVGNWVQKGRKVMLNGNQSANKYHHVWTFAKNGQVATSRKGLSFYRLCKID